MDFKRIARIFILAFGLLNIYLFFGVIERQDTQNISSQPTSDILENIKESNIELPGNLATTDADNLEVYSLQINENTLLADKLEESAVPTGSINNDGAYYRSFPSNPLVLEGDSESGFTESDIKSLEEIIQSELVMFGEEYVFHNFEEDGNRFVFYQESEGIPIVDGSSEISFFINDQGNIISYEQTYAGPGTVQGNELQLISGQRAIEILFLNNEIRQGSSVELPVLTYRRALHLEDLSMYSPAWLITVNHSTERNTFRVDAVNGTIIRQSIPTPTDNNGNGNESGTDETSHDGEDENV